MKINKEIRATEVRLIGKNGAQIGVVPIYQAQNLANNEGLDLVEISPNAKPPVCKIVDYGKLRYQLTKKEREGKKTQQQSKLKEIKVKPNIGDNDLRVKIDRARSFLEKGNKVRVTCMFRGREMAYPELGKKVVQHIAESLADCSQIEFHPKQVGRNLSAVLAPAKKKGS